VYKTKLTKVVHPSIFVLMEHAVGINIHSPALNGTSSSPSTKIPLPERIMSTSSDAG